MKPLTLLTPPKQFPLLLVVLLGCSLKVHSRTADTAWTAVGGDKGNSRYAALDQINRTNVALLEIAWTYHTQDSGTGTTIECTPVVVGGTMFITTVRCRLVALDAKTGCERWRFDPYQNIKIDQPRASGGVNRGVAFWSDGKKERVLQIGRAHV